MKITNIKIKKDESLKLYLKTIIKIPDIKENKLNLVLNKIKHTKSNKEKEVIKKFLIESNLKTVVKIVNNYRGAGISFFDLIQIGNKALIKSIKNWIKKDIKEDFLTYITWQIEGEVINKLINIKKERKVKK